MDTRELDPNDPGRDADWVGNAAAFTCPKCAQVFIVSAVLHRHGRECPGCGGSKGFVEGGRTKDGTARLDWMASN